MIRIMLVDDQTLMRDGLKTILDLEDDMEVIGVCDNGEKAFDMAKKLLPDVILMDIRMPVMNGVESVRLIKRTLPGIVVIMLTTFDDDDYIMEALHYGANGYLLKDIRADKLLEAIRDGVNGNILMPAAVAAKLVDRLSKINICSPPSGKESILDLSEREMEIAVLLAKGYSNKQIASELFITEGTTKNYISSIYNKINISDRTKAVLFLQQRLNVK
jgi:DNA-binding NarL/FixJ family response regulator